MKLGRKTKEDLANRIEVWFNHCTANRPEYDICIYSTENDYNECNKCRETLKQLKDMITK